MDTLTLSNIWSVRGTLYQEKGEYKEALLFFLKCLKLREKLGNITAIARIQLNLGNLYNDMARYHEAIEYLKLSIKNRKRSDFDNSALLSPTNTLGLCYYKLLELDSARRYFLMGKRLIKDSKNSEAITSLLSNIGQFHKTYGSNDSALYYYSKVEDIHRKNDDQAGLSWILNHLGRLYIEQKEFDKGRRMYQEALHLSTSVGLLENQKDILHSLHLLAIEQGDKREARNYLRQYIATNDSLTQNLIDNNIQKTEAEYKTEKLRNQKELSEAIAANAKADAKRSEWWIYGLLASFLVIAAIGFFAFRNYQQKQTIAHMELNLREQQLRELMTRQETETYAALLEGQEMERQRIARDLHDRVGNTLATLRLTLNRTQKANEVKDDIELVDLAVSEVRDIAYNLSSGVLEKHGFNVALKELKALIEKADEVSLQLFLSPFPLFLGQKTALELYRMVQELTGNTLKHAAANTIQIQTSTYENNFSMVFEDDGKGFIMNQVKTGMGLYNLQKRTEKLNGSCHVDTHPGRGTIVVIEIPIA